MIDGRVLPYVKDNSTQNVWEQWSPLNRDLYVFNRDGYLHQIINLDSEFPENEIIETIDQLIAQQ